MIRKLHSYRDNYFGDLFLFSYFNLGTFETQILWENSAWLNLDNVLAAFPFSLLLKFRPVRRFGHILHVYTLSIVLALSYFILKKKFCVSQLMRNYSAAPPPFLLTFHPSTCMGRLFHVFAFHSHCTWFLRPEEVLCLQVPR